MKSSAQVKKNMITRTLACGNCFVKNILYLRFLDLYKLVRHLLHRIRK